MQLKSAFKSQLTTKRKVGMKYKYIFTQEREECRRILTKYPKNDTLIPDKCKKYNMFLGITKLLIDKENVYTNQKQKRRKIKLYSLQILN